MKFSPWINGGEKIQKNQNLTQNITNTHINTYKMKKLKKTCFGAIFGENLFLTTIFEYIYYSKYVDWVWLWNMNFAHWCHIPARNHVKRTTNRRRIARGIDWWYFCLKYSTLEKVIAKKHDFSGGLLFCPYPVHEQCTVLTTPQKVCSKWLGTAVELIKYVFMFSKTIFIVSN